MSPENKQRVIGIIVLVGFIALLIPFLFTGKKERHPLAETEVAIPDQNVSPEQMMEVEAIIEQPAADQKSGSERADQNMEVMSNVLSSPEQATKPNIFPQTIELDQMVVAEDVQSEAQPVVQKVTKPVAPKQAVVKPQSKPKPKAIESKMAGFDKVWSVQVGSFANHNLMQRMVDRLQAKGFHVFLQKITTSKGPMVRVLVGRESTKSGAAELSKKLKAKMDLDGRIIGNTQ